MKTLRHLTVWVFGLVLSAGAAADRIDHYKGKQSETLAQAVANFTEANQRLAGLLEGEVSNSDIGVIHELTYTLENALEKINSELDSLAEVLEEVHVASEKADRETVKSRGKAYLAVTKELNKL